MKKLMSFWNRNSELETGELLTFVSDNEYAFINTKEGNKLVPAGDFSERRTGRTTNMIISAFDHLFDCNGDPETTEVWIVVNNMRQAKCVIKMIEDMYSDYFNFYDFITTKENTIHTPFGAIRIVSADCDPSFYVELRINKKSEIFIDHFVFESNNPNIVNLVNQFEILKTIPNEKDVLINELEEFIKTATDKFWKNRDYSKFDKSVPEGIEEGIAKFALVMNDLKNKS